MNFLQVEDDDLHHPYSGYTVEELNTGPNRWQQSVEHNLLSLEVIDSALSILPATMIARPQFGTLCAHTGATK